MDKEISIVNLVKVCPYSESSLKRWLKAFRKGGADALEPKSTQPKTSPQETPIWIKERVIELRKETGLCAKINVWHSVSHIIPSNKFDETFVKFYSNY